MAWLTAVKDEGGYWLGKSKGEPAGRHIPQRIYDNLFPDGPVPKDGPVEVELMESEIKRQWELADNACSEVFDWLIDELGQDNMTGLEGVLEEGEKCAGTNTLKGFKLLLQHRTAQQATLIELMGKALDLPSVFDRKSEHWHILERALAVWRTYRNKTKEEQG